MVAEGAEGRLDEEARFAHPGYAPDDVGGRAAVPGDGLGDEGAGVVADGGVGGDVGEALCVGAFRDGLCREVSLQKV